jgi:hypothetical protein
VVEKPQGFEKVIRWATPFVLGALALLNSVVFGPVCTSVDCPGSRGSNATAVFLVLAFLFVVWAVWCIVTGVTRGASDGSDDPEWR